ncbi:MAG: YdjY domain-containing protein [Acidobacteriota bacterium]
MDCRVKNFHKKVGGAGNVASVLLLVLVGSAAVLILAAKPKTAPGTVQIRPPGEVEFGATVNARAFNGGFAMPGYHAIVWKGGGAARHALLQANVTDVQILDALESLGARPGNNLTMDAWEERKNPKNPAPDTVIAGPPVQILLRIPGRPQLLALESLLVDSAGRGLEMRLGGNRANIPIWQSGCVVCLYSCPGSKVGNARYTERDYAKDVTRFRARDGILPKDGTEIGVILRLADASPRR